MMTIVFSLVDSKPTPNKNLPSCTEEFKKCRRSIETIQDLKISGGFIVYSTKEGDFDNMELLPRNYKVSIPGVPKKFTDFTMSYLQKY